MADQEGTQIDQLIAEFAGITGVDESRARFYLQSANWDLNTALETFYDQAGDGGDDETAMEDVVEQPAPPAQQQQQQRAEPPQQAPQARSKPSSNVFSLSSYRGEKDEDDEEGGQAFYAGGSEHSGQQILGPDKKKKGKNPTGDLFEAAKQHGATAETDEDRAASSSRPKQSYFRGAGFKLGSDVDPSEQVSASLTKEEMAGAKPSVVVVKFWKNGFSIDAGPLRDFNDPANKEFLDAISRGEVPAELRGQVRNSEVHVNMEDHREVEYVKPKQTLKAFSGAGQMLGSPSPNVNSTATPPPAAPAAGGTSTPTTVAYQVDDSKPVTTIQIRLADGTRLVSKFNHDSTVGDVRRIVASARPNTPNFNLMTTFPNKVLDNEAVTLADAKLLNAVIVQRMT